MQRTRNSTIDTLRIVAIFIVILIHVEVQYPSDTYVSPFLAVLSIFVDSFRISVPFFLITAGYFYGRKIIDGEPPLQLLRRSVGRLLLIFGGWNLIYFLVPSNWIEMSLKYDMIRPIYWHMMHMSKIVMHHPFATMMRGVEGHLWFLPALMTGFLITTGFIIIKREKYLLLFAIMLLGF